MTKCYGLFGRPPAPAPRAAPGAALPNRCFAPAPALEPCEMRSLESFLLDGATKEWLRPAPSGPFHPRPRVGPAGSAAGARGWPMACRGGAKADQRRGGAERMEVCTGRGEEEMWRGDREEARAGRGDEEMRCGRAGWRRGGAETRAPTGDEMRPMGQRGGAWRPRGRGDAAGRSGGACAGRPAEAPPYPGMGG